MVKPALAADLLARQDAAEVGAGDWSRYAQTALKNQDGSNKMTNWSVLSSLDRRAGIQGWSALQTNALFYLCAFVIVCSLLFGGATRGGFLSDAILQLIATPLLLMSLWRLLDTPLTTQARLALGFCAALAALPLLQLIPLPPWLWSFLPNREVSAAAYDLIEQKRPWMPLSVAPHLTWLSALSLIVPLSVFLATLLLGYRERRWLSLMILAVGTLSVFIGLIQVAQGPESGLRFYEITNPTEAVGFFANRNHFAALGYVLILLAAAWTVNAAVIGRDRNRGKYDTASIVAALGCFTLLVVLLAGEAMARSRAGLGLTIVALFGAFALGVSDRRVGAGFTPRKIVLGATALGLLMTVQYTLYRILERFEADPLTDARLSFVPTTLGAAKAYMPLGSGLGTFVPVYALFEKPEDTLVNAYANHAHNDAAELWLETGIFGILLAASFLCWFALRTVEVWRSPPPPEATEVDWSLARAATFIVTLLLVHSFIDYPLRTSAMMAIMAFSCALLIEPLVVPGRALNAQGRQVTRSHRSAGRSEPVPVPSLLPLKEQPKALERPTGSEPPAAPETPVPKAPSGTSFDRWGSDIEWPEEWRESDPPTGKSPPDPKPGS